MIRWPSAVLALLILLTAGCAARRYSVRGLVLAVQPEKKSITISHDPIAGYMDAMVMPFEVKDGSMLARVSPGDRVYFRLSVDSRRSLVDHLRVVSAPPVEPSQWQALPRSRVVRLGEPVPDFRLRDQSDRPVSLSDFRGKIVAVTFIYTRCPLPDYCPRMTSNFSHLARKFGDRLGRELILMSITFDPQYDTPEVLLRYARSAGAEIDGWLFLTGGPDEIARVAGLFGIEYWPDEGAITHNLQTALIDQSGRMAANIEGKDYRPSQLADFVTHLLTPGVGPR